VAAARLQLVKSEMTIRHTTYYFYHTPKYDRNDAFFPLPNLINT